MGAAVTLAMPLFMGTAGAVGGTRYVAPTGTDTGACTAHAHPCATISYAVGQANAGNTVNVAAGTYHETVALTKPLVLKGAGAATTTIDGNGIDSVGSEYGVLYVGATGGTTAVSGFTITNPYPDSYTGGEPEAVALADTNASDTVNLHNNVITEGSSDANASTDFPIGIDSFNNAASTTIRSNTVDGFFQGMLLEDNGPAQVLSNTVQNGISETADTTTYAAEGVFFLSDLAQSVTGQVANGNTFRGYGGYGVIMEAGYNNGNCTDNPCNGSISGSLARNTFTLDPGVAGTSAIVLEAKFNGNDLTATVAGNQGTVMAPSTAISESATGGATFHVTSSNNAIRVIH
jgi:hypothetical protein